ncbi:MAG: ribonuclease HI family protein [Candidatus Goldiibacteriota bacterium]
MKGYSAYTDGASSGNPGDSGIGIVLYKDGESIYSESKYIGVTTNNVAEYTAVVTLLNTAVQNGIKELKIFTDSELLVKQMSGEYKIKNEKLKELIGQINSFKAKINFTLKHVLRDGNTEADKLARQGSKRGAAAKKKME